MNTLTSIHPKSITQTLTQLHTLTLRFDMPLRHSDIPAWRGAVAALAGLEKDIFHNHDPHDESGKTVKHRYPLVQYRVLGGKAALYGVNEGAEALMKMVRGGAFERFEMGGQHLPLRVEHSQQEKGLIQLPEKQARQTYRIYRYVPFSPENYQAYKQLGSLVEKVQRLEELLANHIVTFVMAAGGVIPESRKPAVILQDIDRVKKVRVIDTDLMAFDLVFSVNMPLPEGVGIGRKTAFGYGWTIPL